VSEAAAPVPSVTSARTADRFLGGHVLLVQPATGHRAGLDAALLQALVPATAAGAAIDLGAGVGTVGFSLAARAPGLVVTGIERDADLVACGRDALARPENAAFAARARLEAGDAADPGQVRTAAALGRSGADWVLANPPFDRGDRVRRSPDARRDAAYVGPDGLLAAWTAAAAALLKPGGTYALIHRPEALDEILAALSGGFGAISLRPVHPRHGAPATRLLVTARKARATPLRVLPGLVLHRDDGAWTAETDAILRGAGELAA
jgi:tRNA1(Val) A37 N6-methylase TrmN6